MNVFKQISGWGGWSRLKPATQSDLNAIEKKVMAKLSELQAQLDALNAQLAKATAEIVAEIQNLKDQLANTEIPAGAQASLDALVAKAQSLDDLNPDAPATPAPTPEPSPAPENPPTP